ncbi:MAG TPA: tripartite tricarboxylate transporter substrate binding protein [Ramlibacter sp.]|nr:tripartite tricarboxylate transporter substrate binding protein [Ramlibacter sp.]
MLNRRWLLAISLAAALPAFGQSFPSKPIKVVVPFGAGGVADLTARVVAQKMAESLGQPMVIENKPGAGGVVAGEAVAKAAPDGHTLLLMSNATAVSAGLFNNLPFDAHKDFAPVSVIGSFDLAVMAPSGGKFKNIGELLTYAKANPGKLNIGTINVGSTQNLAAELLKTSAGLDFQVVPFNGSPPLLNALRGGQVDASIEILGPMMGQIKGGALQALAVMGEKRASVLPQVPTLAESGVAKFQVASWNALAAPAGTPAAVIARLNSEVQRALASPDVIKRLEEINVTARGSTPKQLQDLLDSEIKRWTDVIVRAKIPRQ